MNATTVVALPQVVAALVASALVAAAPAAAQGPLSLSDAVARSLAHNPDVHAVGVAERESAERATQARSLYFPHVRVDESWQRGNQPTFVFSSRLAQRQLTPSDFAIEALTHPPAIDNFRTTLSVEQAVFDRHRTASVRTAAIDREMAATRGQLVEQDLTAAVTDAFGAVLVASASVRSASAAVDAARADRQLAGNRRELGRATEADVLQLDVYLARALERQAQATADERIARSHLNQLMGEPLSTHFSLDSAPPPLAMDLAETSLLEAYAVAHRPEVALAQQAEQLASTGVTAARAAFLPQVSAQGAWEMNGGDWHERSASWTVGAAIRISVFDGFGDRARLAEARAHARRRALERDKAETLVRLDVHVALARLDAARASEAAGRAAVDQALESRRIIRDRYDSGLADVALLLRSADALQQAEAQQIAAQASVLTATAHLQRALGR